MGLARITTPLVALATRLAYSPRAYGRERLPARGPALLVFNCTTPHDWLVARAALGSVRFPPPGRIAEFLARGEVVGYFPEGAATRSGAMRPFPDEAGDLLAKLDPAVPVYPVWLDNLWGGLGSGPGGARYFKWPESFRRRVAVQVGEALASPRTAASARAALQLTSAECGVSESSRLLPPVRAFVRTASGWRHCFRRGTVDWASGSERGLSWGRLLVAGWALSRWLAPKLGPAARVGVWMPTATGSVLANVSLALLKRTAVNLNYTAGAEATLSAARQAGLDTIISSERFLKKMPLPPLGDGVRVVALEAAMTEISPWANLLRYAAVVLFPGWFLDRVVLRLGSIRLDDTATVLFSSGSTGEPKGVVLTQRNLAANIDGFRRGIGFTGRDRMLVTLPYFHSFGYTITLWGTLTVCMRMALALDPRQSQEVGDLCKRYECTLMLGTATFLRLYLRRAKPDDFRSLRMLVCGAEKLPVSLADEFERTFGVRPVEGYGCTELSPVVCVNLPQRAGESEQVTDRPGTVGQPIPNVCAAALDCATDEVLPPGEVGMLAVTGANVMSGYLGRPDLSERAMRGRWYLTGDMGCVEADGFIRITGRLARFAKIAGEMVPLERVEDELHDLLGAGGERLIAVAAVPDERRGERVVVLHLPAHAGALADALPRLRERGLPNLWVPDKRDCHCVPEFPSLATGKLDLRRLGELARALASAPAPR